MSETMDRDGLAVALDCLRAARQAADDVTAAARERSLTAGQIQDARAALRDLLDTLHDLRGALPPEVAPNTDRVQLAVIWGPDV